MKVNKRLVIISLLIILSLLVTGLKLNANKTTNHDFDIARDQWALYNYGQTIKNNKGVKGVDINISKAWDITTGNPDVLVAVVDTGVDISITGLSNTIRETECKDFYYNDDTIYDDYFQDYHGTYIANTIAGYDPKRKIYGVAPKVSILPVKFLRGTMGNTDDAVKAIKYACEKGAKIVNCSWNFNEYNQDLYDVMASHPEVLFVCAAGNSNCNLDNQKIYPACYELDNILTVLAVDNKGDVYTSSGRGVKVDVAAPGVDIITKFPEDDITYVSGTSIASAYTSGIAALMLSENASLRPNEIIDIITKTVRKIDKLDGICYSGGIIDAYECVKLVDEKSNSRN